MKYSTARYCSVPINQIQEFQHDCDLWGYEYKFINYVGISGDLAQFEIRKYIHDEENPEEVWDKEYRYKEPSRKRFDIPVLIIYIFFVYFMVKLIIQY